MLRRSRTGRAVVGSNRARERFGRIGALGVFAEHRPSKSIIPPFKIVIVILEDAWPDTSPRHQLAQSRLGQRRQLAHISLGLIVVRLLKTCHMIGTVENHAPKAKVRGVRLY
jgi:hypothetical protein